MKLSTQECQRIRELYAKGKTQKELSALFNTSQTNVSKIVTGATRPDAGGPIATNTIRTGEAHPLSKVTADQVKEMRSIYNDLQIPISQIAPLYGISKCQCRAICTGKAWANT